MYPALGTRPAPHRLQPPCLEPEASAELARWPSRFLPGELARPFPERLGAPCSPCPPSLREGWELGRLTSRLVPGSPSPPAPAPFLPLPVEPVNPAQSSGGRGLPWLKPPPELRWHRRVPGGSRPPRAVCSSPSEEDFAFLFQSGAGFAPVTAGAAGMEKLVFPLGKNGDPDAFWLRRHQPRAPAKPEGSPALVGRAGCQQRCSHRLPTLTSRPCLLPNAPLGHQKAS